ncbi:MAG: hypothetical protein KGY51_02215 [Psychroflexus sp.]|nr:hypothetical protein [Psychroflexus sp.]
MRNYQKINIIALVIFSISCASNNRENLKEIRDNKSLKDDSKIIFLNYKIYKKLDNKVTVDFVKKTSVNGKMRNMDLKFKPNNNDLICFQLDKNSTPLDSLIIPNPFLQTIEYVDESGLFAKKQNQIDTADVTIRMQLNGQTKYILIKEPNKVDLLSKIEL